MRSLSHYRLRVANVLKWAVDVAGPRVHDVAEIVEILSYGLIICDLVVPDHHHKMCSALLFLANTWLHHRLKLHASVHGH